MEEWIYVIIYVCAIVLICAVGIFVFVKKSKRDKNRLNELKKQDKLADVKLTTTDQTAEILPNEKENLTQSEKTEDMFEDFSLDGEEKKQKNESSSSKNFFVNNVDFDDFGVEEDDEIPQGFEDDEDSLEEKYAEYEKFLKSNLEDVETDSDAEDFDEEEKLENQADNDSDELEDEDLKALADFDFNSLEGKNESEILELIKNLPPKAQQILMTDILRRKKYEDED
jgi:hypothetical protein